MDKIEEWIAEAKKGGKNFDKLRKAGAEHEIEKVGKRGSVRIPADARQIDVTGKTVIPGLVDCHAHGAMARSELTPEQNWQLYNNLAFGVTAIHDPSNDTSSIFSAARSRKPTTRASRRRSAFCARSC